MTKNTNKSKKASGHGGLKVSEMLESVRRSMRTGNTALIRANKLCVEYAPADYFLNTNN